LVSDAYSFACNNFDNSQIIADLNDLYKKKFLIKSTKQSDF
jgi:hypothetical protein